MSLRKSLLRKSPSAPRFLKSSYARRLWAETLEDRRVLAVANIVSAPDEIQEEVIDIGFESALVLDGVDDRVDLTAAEAAFDTLTGSFTLEAWIRLDEDATGKQSIVSKGNLWALQVDADAGVAEFILFENPIGIQKIGAINIADGEWHHITGVFRGSGFASMTLYVDGVRDGDGLFLGAGDTVGVNDAQARIGSSSEFSGRDFKGEIDEVRVWNTARTADQIAINRSTQLTGTEAGLVAYYTFNDETATDATGASGDGVLVGGVAFNEPDIIGEIVVQLDAPVTAEPGVILRYEIDGSSTAVQGVDFYASQLDISTVDGVAPTNSVFIPQGQDSAVITLAALPDAVVEGTETIVVNLLSDNDPFTTGPDNYTLGANTSAAVDLFDSNSFSVGLAISNVFGEDAFAEDLHLDANGQVTFGVKLMSQPEANVNVSIDKGGLGGALVGGAMSFTPANWFLPQYATLSGLSGNNDGVEDLLGVLAVDSSGDPAYDLPQQQLRIRDESNTTKVKVDEGGEPQPITPTITIVNSGNSVENDSRPAVLTVASDVVAPAGGITVFYDLQDASGLGSEYTLLDDGVSNTGVRQIVIPEGALTAAILVQAVNDAIDSGDVVVAADLVPDGAYQLGATVSASVLVEEDDTAGIVTAVLTEEGDVTVARPFDDDTFVTTSEAGDDFAFGVRLSSEPITDVTVTITSENPTEGQVDTVLLFNDENWDLYQTVTVVAQDDPELDGDIPYNINVLSSASVGAYIGATGGFDITNQDDESREQPAIDTRNDSSVVATIAPVRVVGEEGGAAPQFEILLSEPAPTGGLSVGYVIFERTATGDDLGVPDLVERIGDDNPLAFTRIDGNFIENARAESLTFGDLDNDGDQDGVLTLENGTSQFLINERTDEIPDFVLDNDISPLVAGGRGAAIGDIDGDGDVDVIQVNAARNGLRYFENQLVESGLFEFTERTGVDNPFDSLLLVDPETPALVDLDNDSQLELVVTRSSSPTSDYFEVTPGGDYFAAGSNPLAIVGSAIGNDFSLTFGDIDRDGDYDAIAGSFDQLTYFENVGSPSDPQFVQRTGDANPTRNLPTGFAQQIPGLVDIDNDGDLDLFHASEVFIGEVESRFEVRYAESPEFQEAFVPEGATSLTVTLPVTDDVIDESRERFEVALLSQQTQTYDVVAASDFDDEFEVRVAEVFADAIGVQFLKSSVSNVQFTQLLAGTVLDFGDAQATVTSTIELDDDTQSTLVPVTFDSGTVEVDDVATVQFDSTVTLFVPDFGDFFDGEVGLQIQSEETAKTVLLQAGTQLVFSGGATLEITRTTLVNRLGLTPVPATLVNGSGVGFFETVDVAAPIGELELQVDEPGVDFYALSAGTVLTLDDGSTFVVTDPAIVTSVTRADYNGDGLVNAADYTVWRDTEGSTINLAADGNGDGVVDSADYNLWVESFGFMQNQPIAVTGYVVGPSIPTAGAGATVVEAGYRITADLEVTAAFDGATVGLRIDETAYETFTIPIGTVLRFEGGAIATVEEAVTLNNLTGTSVAIALTQESAAGTIAVGESSDTADFSDDVTFRVTEDGEDIEGGLFIEIVDPLPEDFVLEDGVILNFDVSGLTVSVFGPVVVDNDGITNIFVDILTPDAFLDEILAGDTASIGFQSLGSIEFTIEDNDEAGVNLDLSGTTTDESGDFETVDVTLQTEPKENVTVILAVDGGEAVLSDADESGVGFVQLTFTPFDWDVPQQVTVTGIDDDLDDGDIDYTLRTTTLSADNEYADEIVDVFFRFDISDSRFALLQIEDLNIPDAVLPQNTLLFFENGAVVRGDIDENVLLRNDQTSLIEYAIFEPVDTIPAGETATAVDFILDNDDFKTDVEVATAYDSGTGVVGLRIELDESDVLSATLLAGYEFVFSNGAVAQLDSDVTLLGGGSTVLAAVALVEGTEIPAGATMTFAETLEVTTAYDPVNGDIGLSIADSLVSAIGFDFGTEFEFSNGAYGTVAAAFVISQGDELIVDIALDPNTFSSQASGFYSEQLVEPVTFTNDDDDFAGITIRQTDPTLAVVEGAVNNFFTVVLESEPTAVVALTLTPSDDNIRLESEFMGEPLTIFFDPANWDAPQTIEVSAVDDVLLEYDHMSSIAVGVVTDDPVYAGVALPNDVEVFIADDELPTASVVIVAGAIEANSPGYFLIELDAPAPRGHGDTGIVVTYAVGGTAQATGDLSNTPDVQPITGTARIAPGETRSQIIAFPIDDFLTEGLDLQVTENYVTTGLNDQISLAINVEPFSRQGAYVPSGMDPDVGTVALQLNERFPGDPNVETTILSQGTVLLFAGATTATVTETTIVRDDLPVDVPIELGTATDTIINSTSGDVFQRVPVPAGAELEFQGGVILSVTTATDVSNDPSAVANVPVSQAEGEPLMITAGSDAAATQLPGESVVVSITTDPASEYRLGDDASGAIIILDNDKPGVRIAEAGDQTVTIEGEGSAEFMVSLLSQPQTQVDVVLTAPMTSRTLALEAAALASDTIIRLKVDDPSVVSLLLPQGDYDFGGGKIATVLNDVTLFSDSYADVDVSLNAALALNDTAAYAYSELLFDEGGMLSDTITLEYTGVDWFRLQTVTLVALDDVVVETGESHTTDIEYTVVSLDPNYNNFETPNQPITIIDRRFDVDNTTDALIEGFLSLETSIESVELPILGDLGEVAPPIFEPFLESLVEEILATENLTAETLGEAFTNAINAQLTGLNTLPVEFVVTGVSADEIAFNLSFGDSLEESVPLDGSLGLEALNLSVESEGTIDLFVDYLASVGFGISQGDGFFLNTEETFFDVAAGIGLSDDFAATGTLGFLQLDLENAVNFADATVVNDFDIGETDTIELDIDAGEIDGILLEVGQVIVLDSGVEITVAEEIEITESGIVAVIVGDATDAVAAGDTVTLGDVDGTMLDAAFSVTLVDPNDTSGDDTRLTLSELTAARGGDPLDFIDYGFSGEAALDLDVATTVSGNTAFPSFSFNLASTLPLFNYADEEEAGADETPTLTVDTGFTGVAEGATTTLLLTVSGVTSSARLTKGTQLQFGQSRLVVDKTVTFSPDGTESVRVKVIGDGDSVMGEPITIGAGESATLASSAFNIAFNDITLDLGGFVTDLLGPVISGINDVLEPFQPVIDVLSSEVKLFSTIGLADAFDQDGDGAATLIEIGLTLGGGLTNENAADKVFRFIDAVTGVIEVAGTLAELEESIENGDNLAINFGSYVLQNFKGGSSSTDATEVDAENDGVSDEPDTSPEDQTMASGNSSVTGFFDSLDELGITLDVVENPLNVVKLLLGQDIDIVTWDVPELDFSFEIERSFPVFAGINGIIRGGFNVYSDLVFGFDTAGFTQWKENDFAVEYAYLVLDGFYVSDIDPETGEDIPELTLDATIAAGVEANAVIASIAAIGGVSGSAELDLIDIGEYSDESDGRIRGSEIFSRISRPATLLELTGSIDAFLSIEVKIGINLGFWKIQVTVFERELARVTLFEFTIGGGGESGSSLATSNVVADTTDFATAAPLAAASADPGPTAPLDAPKSVSELLGGATPATPQTPRLAIAQADSSQPRYVVQSGERPEPSFSRPTSRPPLRSAPNEEAKQAALDLIYAGIDTARFEAARRENELDETMLKEARRASDEEADREASSSAFAEYVEQEKHLLAI